MDEKYMHVTIRTYICSYVRVQTNAHMHVTIRTSLCSFVRVQTNARRFSA